MGIEAREGQVPEITNPDPLSWNDAKLREYILEHIWLAEGTIRGDKTREHDLLSEDEKGHVVRFVTKLWRPTTIDELAKVAGNAKPYMDNGKPYETFLRGHYSKLLLFPPDGIRRNPRQALTEVKNIVATRLVADEFRNERYHTQVYSGMIIRELGAWRLPRRRKNPYVRYL